MAHEAHVLLTNDEETALNFATFAPVHSRCDTSDAGSMFPDFDALEAEGTRVRTVEESEIIPHLRTSCAKKLLSSAVTEELCKKAVPFRKYFIPRSAVRLANDTLQSQIFNCMEDLVMQHVDVRSRVPVIRRVIAIDCPSQVFVLSHLHLYATLTKCTFQRERFCTALKRSEARGPRPWPSGSSFVGIFSLLGLRIRLTQCRFGERTFPKCAAPRRAKHF